MEEYVIHVVSDSLGETAEKVTRAAAEQFGRTNYRLVKHTNIVSREQAKKIIEEALEDNSIIVFTTVVDMVRRELIGGCKANNIVYVDILEPALVKFQEFLGMEPLNEIGLLHRLDDRYYEKVEALEFAVKYDDGRDPRGILEADIVILGISRTSKTPLCMYLAMKNLKVANVPLLPEVKVPEEIYKISPKKLIGLTNDVSRLNEIRLERLRSLGLKDDALYADSSRIIEEIKYATDIMNEIGCPIINVSHKAIEETANLIEKIILKAREEE